LEGEDRVLQKFGEEAIETLIALKNSQKDQIILETADLLYSLILSLVVKGAAWQEVMEELAKRFKE
jgi:phosphoribosyl-ATP pyrophosphohydrolase/phosphoribosyl-AMP cyclohydrolase